MIKCEQCGRLYVYNKKRGHSKTKCNSCVVNTRRFKLKEKIVEFLGGKCVICGYSKCFRALNAHHVDPEKKKLDISSNHCLRWSRIEHELNKCVLLCSNCHAEVHAGLASL